METFFIGEDGRGGERFEFGCEEAILSSSDPCDLDKALMKGIYHNWRVLGRKDTVGDRFREQAGWIGDHFTRLVDDVFLFYGEKRSGGLGWYIIRISVP